MSSYIRRRKYDARLAYEFVRNAGYPSVGEAIHLLTDDNVRNLPKILPVDVERAYRIYGVHPEYVKGQLVKRTVAGGHHVKARR